MLILVAVLAFPQIKEAIRGDPAKPAHYYEAPRDTRVNYGVLYLGLVAFLAMMSYSVHGMIKGGSVG